VRTIGRRRDVTVAEFSSDAELLCAVAAREVEALRLLHLRHAPWLRVRLTRRCADPDAVDAAVQDTFVAVWRDAHRFQPLTDDGDAAAWIWTIAIRRLLSALRGRAHRWLAEATEAEFDRIAGTTRSAEEMVLLGVEHGELGAALSSLSPELRAVIQATVLDGLTVREAAELLGIPEGTAKTRVMRAKARLRAYLARPA
jgi:RNA polymerase sigma-70 factor (ECF subfamily)